MNGTGKIKIANNGSELTPIHQSVNPSIHQSSLNILMILFTHRQEGTYYRAFPWAEYLVSKGHRVTLLCTSSQHLFRGTVSVENGVRIIEAPELFSGRLVMTRLCGLYGWGPLDILARWREIRRGNYDVVHTFEHQLHVSLPVFLAGREHVPVLVSDWCDHYGKGGFRETEYSPYRLTPLYKMLGFPFRMLMDHLEGALRRRADAVTVISTFLRQRAAEKGVPAERIHLIPGSADTVNIQVQSKTEARRKLGLDETPQYALFFGAGQFDVDFSLEAFARIQKEDPNSRFIIVGKKDRAVARKAAELGVQDQIIQTGWIDDAALGDWLACADVCLLPMKNNPPNRARWPNKIGFYMAAGRPVIATGVNDVGELIETGDIGLVSQVDVQDFANKTLCLFRHRQLAMEMGERARYIAENEFALPIHGAQLEQLYLNLTKSVTPLETEHFNTTGGGVNPAFRTPHPASRDPRPASRIPHPASSPIRTLNLAYTLPEPPFNGYDLRHLNLMKNLADRVDQTLFCRIMKPLTPQQEEFVRQLPYDVRTVLVPRPTPLEKFAKGLRFLFSRFPVLAGGWYSCEMKAALEKVLAEETFDFIVLEGIWNAVYWPVLKQSKAKKVLNLYDLEAGLLKRQADVLPPGFKQWLYRSGAQRMAALERDLPREADLIWTVSEKERQELLAHTPHLPVYLAPGGVDCDALRPLPPSIDTEREILFVGSLQYLPNVDGVRYLANDVMPEILKRCPDAVLNVVGRKPDERTTGLDNPPSFNIVGEVDELEPWYLNSRLCIVPLRSGGGTRLKILEAMAYGRPVVSTSIGAEGIDIEHGKNILIADTPEELAEAVALILNSPEKARSIAAEGRRLVEERYAWTSIADILYERYACQNCSS